jgi:hypothetical protein
MTAGGFRPLAPLNVAASAPRNASNVKQRASGRLFDNTHPYPQELQYSDAVARG